MGCLRLILQETVNWVVLERSGLKQGLSKFGCARSVFDVKSCPASPLWRLGVADAIQTWLANAPGVRGGSTLRARADVFVARFLGHANWLVGTPRVVACANPPLRSAAATRHVCGLGWGLRTGGGAIKAKLRFNVWRQGSSST